MIWRKTTTTTSMTAASNKMIPNWRQTLCWMFCSCHALKVASLGNDGAYDALAHSGLTDCVRNDAVGVAALSAKWSSLSLDALDLELQLL